VPLVAAVAQCAVGLNDVLDPGQVFRQRSPVDLAGRRSLRRRDQRIGLALGLGLRNPRLDILQSQFELIRIDLLGFAPEEGLPEGGDQRFQARILRALLWATIMALSASTSSGRSAVAIMAPIYQSH
jgi:hypothetical protein